MVLRSGLESKEWRAIFEGIAAQPGLSHGRFSRRADAPAWNLKLCALSGSSRSDFMQQCVGRLDRLQARKKFVQVCQLADATNSLLLSLS